VTGPDENPFTRRLDQTGCCNVQSNEVEIHGAEALACSFLDCGFVSGSYDKMGSTRVFGKLPVQLRRRHA